MFLPFIVSKILKSIVKVLNLLHLKMKILKSFVKR